MRAKGGQSQNGGQGPLLPLGAATGSITAGIHCRLGLSLGRHDMTHGSKIARNKQNTRVFATLNSRHSE